MELLLNEKKRELAQKRWEICNTCPELVRSAKPLERCRLCGCIMRAKVLIPSANCPKGRWT